jgi:SSU ribosomal protein S8E
MGIWMKRSLRKPSGGRIRPNSGKKKREISREVMPTTIGVKSIKKIRVTGNNEKSRVLKIDRINVTDRKTGETVVAEIKNVVENPANPHYVRRNIINKGAVLETNMGKIKVTSRSGQNGALNGVLLE